MEINERRLVRTFDMTLVFDELRTIQYAISSCVNRSSAELINGCLQPTLVSLEKNILSILNFKDGP